MTVTRTIPVWAIVTYNNDDENFTLDVYAAEKEAHSVFLQLFCHDHNLEEGCDESFDALLAGAYWIGAIKVQLKETTMLVEVPK